MKLLSQEGSGTTLRVQDMKLEEFWYPLMEENKDEDTEEAMKREATQNYRC